MIELILAVWAAFSDPICMANYERIQWGMQRQEVIRLLGEPTGDKSKNFTFSGTIHTWDLQRESECWDSGTFRIWVRFEEGRVIGEMRTMEADNVKHFVHSLHQLFRSNARNAHSSDPFDIWFFRGMGKGE